MGLLARLVPNALTFVYLPDEPTPDRFPEVRRIADEVHANPGPGRALPTLVTRTIEPALAGAVDIWVAPPQALDLTAAAAEQRAGHRVWSDNHGRPNGPALVIDAPPTDARSCGWAAFKHHLTATSSGMASTGNTTRRSRASAGRTSGRTRLRLTIADSRTKPISGSSTGMAC